MSESDFGCLSVAGIIGALLAFGFMFDVIWFMRKQRAANRLLLQSLEAIAGELKKLNAQTDSANKMQGDLNRAAQWFVDRESTKH